MARRRVSDARQEAAAYQAALRTIARGERPLYRAMQAQDGDWYVLGYPWLSIDANDHRSAVEVTRALSLSGWASSPTRLAWRADAHATGGT
jgi:hypothetical protein